MASPPELLFDGRDVVAVSDRERTRIRAREMGFVFQDFNLVPTLSAVENVVLAADYAGNGGAAGRSAALEALDRVGLAERAGHRPSELSGGEQQRVAIARALVNRPRLVLADEPTGNLDSERSAEVLALLRRANREQGQTFILVTHDNDVGEACDRVVRMRDGLIRAPAPVTRTDRARDGRAAGPGRRWFWSADAAGRSSLDRRPRIPGHPSSPERRYSAQVLGTQR